MFQLHSGLAATKVVQEWLHEWLLRLLLASDAESGCHKAAIVQACQAVRHADLQWIRQAWNAVVRPW